MEDIDKSVIFLKKKIESLENELSRLKNDNINLKNELTKQNYQDEIKELKETNINFKKEVDNLQLATNHNVKQLFKKQVLIENYMQVTQVTIEEIGKELNDLIKKVKNDTTKINSDLHKIEQRFNTNQSNIELHAKKLKLLLDFKERCNTTISNLQSKLEIVEERFLNETLQKNQKHQNYKSLQNKLSSLEKNIRDIQHFNLQNNINELIDSKNSFLVKELNNKIDTKISKKQIEQIVRNELNDIISKSILEIQDNINIDKVLQDNKKTLMNEIRNSISLSNSTFIKQYSESMKNIIDKFTNVQKHYDIKFDVVNNKFKKIEDSTVEIKTHIQKAKNIVPTNIESIVVNKNKKKTKNDCNDNYDDKNIDSIKIRLSQIETQLIHQMNMIMSQIQSQRNQITTPPHFTQPPHFMPPPNFMTSPHFIPQYVPPQAFSMEQ